MEKSYSPFFWHNKALKEHPEYQMEGMMDCLREEIGMAMPVCHPEEPVQITHKIEFSKKQYDMIDELIAEVLHYRKEYPKLLIEIEKLRAIASKGKSKRYKGYKYSNKNTITK